MADRTYDHTPKTGPAPAGSWDPDELIDFSSMGKVGPSRADGADPHDSMGHPVDYAGQDCPRCRDDFNRGL